MGNHDQKYSTPPSFTTLCAVLILSDLRGSKLEFDLLFSVFCSFFKSYFPCVVLCCFAGVGRILTAYRRSGCVCLRRDVGYPGTAADWRCRHRGL